MSNHKRELPWEIILSSILLLTTMVLLFIDRFDRFDKYELTKSVSSPAFSPDGGQIVYLALDYGTGGDQVFLFDRQTSTVTKLTNLKNKYPNSVIFSLDGNSIIFTLGEDDYIDQAVRPQDDGVYVIDIESKQTRKLANIRQIHNPIHILDGTMIAVTDWQGDSVFIVNVKTGEIRELAKLHNGDADNPKISQDGKTIAYEVNGQIFVVDEGALQSPHPITLSSKATTLEKTFFAISPKGDLIAFGEEFRGPFDLGAYCADQVFIVNVKTGDKTRLTKFYDYGISQLVFSPDGNTIAFSAVKCANGGFAGSHVGIVKLDSSVEEFTDFGIAYVTNIFFSPNGTLFGFTSYGDPYNENARNADVYVYKLGK
ncbi:MAG: PD40 domain-containing protein [Chloroflexi bacterium]|nr:PD40 domain-containing protein [Chloroflexota bacterium]